MKGLTVRWWRKTETATERWEAEKRLALLTGRNHRQERQAAGIEVTKWKGIYEGRRKGTTKADSTRAKQLRAKG